MRGRRLDPRIFSHTVDGRNPAPLGMYPKPSRKIMGNNYQPQLVEWIPDFWLPSTVVLPLYLPPGGSLAFRWVRISRKVCATWSVLLDARWPAVRCRSELIGSFWTKKFPQEAHCLHSFFFKCKRACMYIYNHIYIYIYIYTLLLFTNSPVLWQKRVPFIDQCFKPGNWSHVPMHLSFPRRSHGWDAWAVQCCGDFACEMIRGFLDPIAETPLGSLEMGCQGILGYPRFISVWQKGLGVCPKCLYQPLEGIG